MIFKKFICFILLLFCVGAVFAFSQDQELLDEQTEATALESPAGNTNH